jgi:hypothetical protein
MSTSEKFEIFLNEKTYLADGSASSTNEQFQFPVARTNKDSLKSTTLF